MGYMLAHGTCFGCGRLFAFNPERVPSIRNPNTGEKEPVCADCIASVNARRIANGLPPHVPLAGAYDPEEVV